MKRSRFLCENCGVEVKPNARICKSCGRFFSAVRCPRCLYTDEAGVFVYGCPKCGYAGSGEALGVGSAADPGEWEVLGDAESVGVKRGHGRLFLRSEVPGWVYYLAAGILTAVFFALVFVYLNL